MRLQALAPVAHPRLAEVADGALTQTKHTSNYRLSTVDWPSAAFGNICVMNYFSVWVCYVFDVTFLMPLLSLV